MRKPKRNTNLTLRGGDMLPMIALELPEIGNVEKKPGE